MSKHGRDSIKRQIAVEIDPTPEELARVLASMSGDDQALFFNALARADKEWQFSWPFQLQFVTFSEKLDTDGRRIMEMIGEYGAQTGEG